MSRPIILSLAIAVVAVAVVGGGPAQAQESSNAQLDCDPFLHGIASFVIPGWGQWLNQERGKAVLHIVGGVGLSAATWLFYPTNLSWAAGVARSLLGFYSTYDAFATCANAQGQNLPNPDLGQ